MCTVVAECYELLALTAVRRDGESEDAWKARQARALAEVDSRLLVLFHALVQARPPGYPRGHTLGGCRPYMRLCRRALPDTHVGTPLAGADPKCACAGAPRALAGTQGRAEPSRGRVLCGNIRVEAPCWCFAMRFAGAPLGACVTHTWGAQPSGIAFGVVVSSESGRRQEGLLCWCCIMHTCRCASMCPHEARVGRSSPEEKNLANPISNRVKRRLAGLLCLEVSVWATFGKLLGCFGFRIAPQGLPVCL